MIKAVIFDMGGVILRTMDRTTRTALAARFGLSCDDLEIFVFGNDTAAQATIGVIPEEAHWQAVGAKFGLDDKQMVDFQMNFWHGDAIDKDLRKFIDSLRPKQHTALLSNAFGNARKMLNTSFPGTLEVFDTIVFSAEVGLAKPDPRIYHLVLDKVHVQPSEAIFVDDVRVNIEVANAVGIHGIRFQNTQQAVKDVIDCIQHG
ncbi:MAG TPA: HAD family phosphatase [Longilinea sp.]|nr:HAD family phosphatase [Longilinea sp.]